MSGWQFCIWRSHNTFHVADPVYSKLRTAVDELSLSFWLHTFTRSVTQPAKKQHPGLYWEVELLVSYHHCLSDAHEIEQHSVSYLLVYQMRVASQGFSIYNNLGGDWLQSHFSGEALMSVTTVATSLWIQFLWSYWNEAKTKQNKKKQQHPNLHFHIPDPGHLYQKKNEIFTLKLALTTGIWESKYLHCGGPLNTINVQLPKPVIFIGFWAEYWVDHSQRGQFRPLV